MKPRASKAAALPSASVSITAETFRISAETQALALSPDERTLATWDGVSVRLTDARSGQLVRRASVDGFGARSNTDIVAFSGDGALLFVSAEQLGDEPRARVMVLDATTLEVLRSIEPEFAVTALVAQPGASSMVIVVGERVAKFDAQTGRIVAEFATNGAPSPAQRAIIAPNGRWLATKSDSAVSLWDLATHERTKRYPLETWSAAIAFSSDSERLFLCAQSRLVTIPVTSEAPPTERTLAADVVQSSFGPTALFALDDDEMLLCLGRDLRVFDAQTLKLRRSAIDRCTDGGRVLARSARALFGNNGAGAIERVDLEWLDVSRPSIASPARAIAWSNEGTIVLAHDEALWKARLATETIEPVWAFDAEQQHIGLSADGSHAAVARPYSGGPMLVIETGTRSVTRTLPALDASIVAVRNDGSVVAALQGTRLLLVREGVEPRRVTIRSSKISRGAFVDERTLCCISSGGVSFADAVTGAETRFVKVTGCAAMATNGRGLVTVATAASLRVFDSSGAELRAFNAKGARFTSAAMSVDGAVIVGATEGGKVLIARADSGEAALRAVCSRPILAVGLSPDASRIAVATHEPELAVYEVASLLR